MKVDRQTCMLYNILLYIILIGGITVSFKISLAGDLGSGKSTVSRIIIARTGAEYYSTGTVCRKMAAEHGMTIDEFNRYMETHPETDKLIDDGLRALSDDPRSLIIDSRMAFHFVKNTFRVYLTTDPMVSAARILADKRAGESFDTVEETAKRVSARRASENFRYFEKYGVHIMDMQNYDLVLDTTDIAPETVADLILTSLSEWEADSNKKFCYLGYRRFYANNAPAQVETAAIARTIDLGGKAPVPTVFEDGGRYYILNGTETVLAHRIAGKAPVPCDLIAPTDKNTEGYSPLFEDDQ